MEDILEKDEAKDIKPEEYVTKYNIYVLDYASSEAIAFSVIIPNSVFVIYISFVLLVKYFILFITILSL